MSTSHWEEEGVEAGGGGPWPAFADLLAATSLLFLILFAVVALPAIMRNRSANAKENTLRVLYQDLQPNSGAKYQVSRVGDYLLIRIPESATFPKDSYSLSAMREDGKRILDHFAQRIESQSLLDSIDQIQVVGHTSSEGSDSTNWRLSSQRAATVALYLIQHDGLPACRVTALGRGRYYPVNPDLARRTTIPQPADRRIELEIRPVVVGDSTQQAQRDRCVERPGVDAGR